MAEDYGDKHPRDPGGCRIKYYISPAKYRVSYWYHVMGADGGSWSRSQDFDSIEPALEKYTSLSNYSGFGTVDCVRLERIESIIVGA